MLSLWDRLSKSWAAVRPVARIAMNRTPHRSSWGGGNQWLAQFVRWLHRAGYSVGYQLDRRVDCVLLITFGESATFGPGEIRSHRARWPVAPCIHRVNDNDLHRGTCVRDKLLAEMNECADHTIFVSEWLRDYHSDRWFDRCRPHSVIHNGADPQVFHPTGSRDLAPGGVLRLVTHHWSDNWRKGFDCYEEIDRLIATGALDRTELWVIGRWPSEIRWRRAMPHPPVHGTRLARLLRSCHVYVTASRAESGPMHFIEGLQCGLPVLYHQDGGGIVEVAAKFGVGFRDDVQAGIQEVRERYAELRSAVLDDAPSGDSMCAEYERLIRKVIGVKRATE